MTDGTGCSVVLFIFAIIEPMANKQPDLRKDADQVLQGIRIVLPGTQALMGFQFIAFFNQIFQDLPSRLKYLHFITLIFTILCTILLIAPVAFHQLGEEGNTTNRFLDYTRKMLSIAMAFLLLAITGEVYVAARVIDIRAPWATLIATFVFLAGGLLWFVLALVQRNSTDSAP